MDKRPKQIFLLDHMTNSKCCTSTIALPATTKLDRVYKSDGLPFS